jgi:hypothetical protein
MLPLEKRDLSPERTPLVSHIIPELESYGRESKSQQRGNLFRIMEQNIEAERHGKE